MKSAPTALQTDPRAGAGSRSGDRTYLFLSAFVAACGGFLFGYDIYIISPAVIFLEEAFDLTSVQVGFAITSAILGCMAGPLFAGGLSDHLGRRTALQLAALLFGISAVGTAVATNMPVLYLFRFVGGVAIGIASVVSPMYIAEIAPARIRGALVTMNQLAITVGGLCSVVVCYFLSFSGAWRWMFASEVAPVIVFAVGLLYVPRSPRWLMAKGRHREAMDVLERVHGTVEARRERAAIEESLQEAQGTLAELFRPGLRMALVAAVGLAFFQQWAGASTVATYAPLIFQKAGFLSASDAIFQTLFLVALNVTGTVVAITLLDRSGRRPLLLVGTAGIALSQFLIGLHFHQGSTGTLVVLSVLLCIGFYSISMAPLTWLIMSEVFPTRLRGKAMALCATFLWTSAFVTGQLFPSVTEYFELHEGSPAGVFWIFGGIAVVALLFGWKLVPETKGHTLEEIAEFWRRPAAGARRAGADVE
ncbi:MAG: sugar porter family MFS transporter [Vicinamibacteraceae bacterium]